MRINKKMYYTVVFMQYESLSLHLLCGEMKQAAKVLNEL